jgi:hypothetical protein
MLIMMMSKVRNFVRRHNADTSLYWARNEGDWSALADHIRQGGLITPEMKVFFADILDKKIAPPVGTAFTLANNRIKHKRVKAVVEEMESGISETAAIAIVAEREGVDTSTIRRAVKKYRDLGLLKVGEVNKELDHLAEKGFDLAQKELMQGRHSGFLARYALSRNGGLNQYCGTTDGGTTLERLEQLRAGLKRVAGIKWDI